MRLAKQSQDTWEKVHSPFIVQCQNQTSKNTQELQNRQKKRTWEDWRVDFEEIYADRFMYLLLQLQQSACERLTESIILQSR